MEHGCLLRDGGAGFVLCFMPGETGFMSFSMRRLLVFKHRVLLLMIIDHIRVFPINHFQTAGMMRSGAVLCAGCMTTLLQHALNITDLQRSLLNIPKKRGACFMMHFEEKKKVTKYIYSRAVFYSSTAFTGTVQKSIPVQAGVILGGA